MNTPSLHSRCPIAHAAIILLGAPIFVSAADNLTSSADATVFLLPSGAVGNLLSTSGEGTRLIWYPKKGAFRAGTLTGTTPTQWNETSIGMQSFAAGFNVTASNSQSTAFGNGTVASGSMATALGYNTAATGPYGAFSSGWSSVASGGVAHALGSTAVASGSYSLATGANTLASGSAATAMGASTRAEGTNATSLGFTTKANSFASLVIGQYNDSGTANAGAWVATGPVFVIGNGYSTTVSGSPVTVGKNALVVRKNGDMGVQGVLRVWPAGDISMGGFTAGTQQPPAR